MLPFLPIERGLSLPMTEYKELGKKLHLNPSLPSQPDSEPEILMLLLAEN